LNSGISVFENSIISVLSELKVINHFFDHSNCGVGNSNKLDHLQLEAARIVTGLPIFASSILIYKELLS
jgi:hypothetical protein